MSERATVTQVTQIGVEATPGTAVSANRRLQALSVEPAIKTEIQPVRPAGGKFPVLTILGKEWIEAKLGGDVACYNHLAYLFSGILGYAAPAQQGSTSAYLWTFTPEQSTEDTIKTYTIEHGSSVRAGKFTYGIVTGVDFSFDRSKVEVSGSLIGMPYQDDITLTSGATAIAVSPIATSDVDVYMDSTSSGLGTTQLTRVLSGEFSISDRFGPVWTVDSTASGFAVHVEQAPKVQLKLLVEADSAGMGPLSAMRSGEKRYIRVKAVGPQIESTYYYTLQMDICGMVSDVSEFSDEDGVYAVEWVFDVTHDGTWGSGKAVDVQLTNTLSEL